MNSPIFQITLSEKREEKEEEEEEEHSQLRSVMCFTRTQQVSPTYFLLNLYL